MDATFSTTASLLTAYFISDVFSLNCVLRMNPRQTRSRGPTRGRRRSHSYPAANRSFSGSSPLKNANYFEPLGRPSPPLYPPHLSTHSLDRQTSRMAQSDTWNPSASPSPPHPLSLLSSTSPWAAAPILAAGLFLSSDPYFRGGSGATEGV